MRLPPFVSVFRHIAPALVVGVLLSACAESTTGPEGELLLQQDLSLEQMGQHVAAPARVDVILYEDGLVARRVVVKTGDERAEHELLFGTVTGISAEGDQGTLSLGFGAQVSFDVETGFLGPHGDEIGFEQFVAHVAEALSVGRKPRVKAGRRAPDTPQAPDDPAFRAALLRLTDDPVPSRIVMNVDADNLRRVDSPPPDAILTLLGLPIELRVSEGLTQLILDRDHGREVAFEGIVRAVRADRGAFILVHGDREIVVRVVDRTRLALNGEPIPSLAPIARALEAGLTVRAVGEGVVREGEEVILAIVVRFGILEHREVAFEGRVRSVNLEAQTFALGNGAVVRVGPDTRMAFNGQEIESLARVADALEAGQEVFAYGEGVVRPDAAVILARFVRFKTPATADMAEFAGRVRGVSLDAGVFLLVEGPAVKITDRTVFAEGSALTSLEEVARALEQNLIVFAQGHGVVIAREPRVIAAAVVKFRVGD